jgi:uncharacterized membrane protein
MKATHPEREVVYQPMRLPERREISVADPQKWLAEGWKYFISMKGPSLAYGAVFALIGMVITWEGLKYPQFILTFWSGFLLIGPLLAVGLFRLAQQADRGDVVKMTRCYKVFRTNLGTVALFTLLLAIVMIAWIRFSTLAAALYVGNVTGTADFLAAMMTPEGLGFLAVLFGVGAVFALIMFALTAWSLPLVMDGRADFGPAIVASVRAVTEQPLQMLTWAGIVAGLTVLGMLTFFAAFAVIFPWLGYSTWVGYKAVFGSPEQPAQDQ